MAQRCLANLLFFSLFHVLDLFVMVRNLLITGQLTITCNLDSRPFCITVVKLVLHKTRPLIPFRQLKFDKQSKAPDINCVFLDIL